MLVVWIIASEQYRDAILRLSGNLVSTSTDAVAIFVDAIGMPYHKMNRPPIMLFRLAKVEQTGPLTFDLRVKRVTSKSEIKN